MQPLWKALIVLAAVVCWSPAHAQTRAELIDAITRETAIDFPITRRQVLPRLARERARKQLANLGVNAALGPDWTPINLYWQRAEEVFTKDLAGGIERDDARSKQDAANLREALAQFTDAQLAEAARFFRSSLYRKWIRYADASMAMLMFGLSSPQGEAQAAGAVETVTREFERNRLTPEELDQIAKASQLPVVVEVARANVTATQGLADPASLLRPKLSDTAARALLAIVGEFRVAHNRPEAAQPAQAVKAEPALNPRLIAAVRASNVAEVKRLLEAGAEVEARDERPHTGETSLHHAARTGNVDIAALLVAKGASVNVRGPSGFTPLHVASGLNRRNVAEYLLKMNADPNAMDASAGTPLHVATSQGHPALVQLLLEKGADPNSRSTDGRTPLHMFSQINHYFDPAHTRVIELLVKHGADINARDSQDKTPLDVAIKSAVAPLTRLGATTSAPR